MQSFLIPIALTILTYFITRTHTLSIEDLAAIEGGKYDRDVNDEQETPTTDLRKLLLKKLRFRELLKEDMPFSNNGFGRRDLDDESRENHKASKRRNMNDILSRVRALLTDMKERDVKDTMSLPSLRFGRSGMNYHGSR